MFENTSASEPYFAQIRKLISKIITGSDKSRFATTQERNGAWMVPGAVMENVIVNGSEGGTSFQEGAGQAGP